MDQQKEIEELKREILQLKQQNLELQPPPSGPRRFPWRTFWSWLFIVLSLVSLVPAALLIWFNRTIMDPAQYIKTVGPVIRQPAVQKAIVTNSTDQLFSAVNVQQAVSSALPPEAQFLASPIASQVKSQTTSLLNQIVASPQFYNLWIKVNTKAQATFVNIAKNSNGDPHVDISDIYSFLSKQLSDTSLAPVLNKQLPPKVGDIQVVNMPALATIPHFVAQLQTWRWVLLGLTILLAALAVWVARIRRRALLLIGAGWMLATLLTLIAVRLARNATLSHIPNPVNNAAAQAIWQTMLHYLWIQLAVMFVVGLAVVITGWVLGPSRAATRIRNRTHLFLLRTRSRLVRSPQQVPAIVFLQGHRRHFEWTVLGLTALCLLLLAPLTVAVLLLVILVALVILFALELFAVT